MSQVKDGQGYEKMTKDEMVRELGRLRMTAKTQGLGLRDCGKLDYLRKKVG